MFDIIACMCGLDPTTRRERPIIQHKLYVYNTYIKVGSIFSRGHLSSPARLYTHTQSLVLHPESVQRYRRRRHRDRILFYYTGELMPRSYYTYIYMYIIHVIVTAYDLSVIYFGSRIIDMS
jgi:hypothetical protein